jgi:hypothetical protein
VKHICVIVESEAVEPIRSGERDDVARLVQSHRGDFRPMHATRDDALDKYFEATVPDEHAETLVGQLVSIPGVQSAYIQPENHPANV